MGTTAAGQVRCDSYWEELIFDLVFPWVFDGPVTLELSLKSVRKLGDSSHEAGNLYLEVQTGAKRKGDPTVIGTQGASWVFAASQLLSNPLSSITVLS